jgi:hypothetical protein
MNSRKLSKRPPVTRETRAEPPQFEIQEMPDPMGHLTEEQKKWPVLDLNALKNDELSQAAVPSVKTCVLPRQPTATRKTRGGPQEFIVQEMPDPWGHLTEEQKQWPLCDLDTPHTPGESPIDSATPTPATPKPTEG